MALTKEQKELAKTFYEKFSSIIEKNRVAGQKAWPHDKDFTDFIIPKIKETITACGEYETQKEYFRIDAIGWEQKRGKTGVDFPEEKDNYKFQEYAWNLKIAVEHENNDKLWMDEIIKLAHIFCDLRVVIGYIPLSLKNEHDNYLKFVSDTIKKSELNDNMKNGAFLLIIGNSKCNNKEQYLNYTPYLYIKEDEEYKFKKMQDWMSKNNKK